MPQMSPMNWILLSSWFFLLSTIMKSSIHFYKNNSTNKNVCSKISVFNSNMKW